MDKHDEMEQLTRFKLFIVKATDELNQLREMGTNDYTVWLNKLIDLFDSEVFELSYSSGYFRFGGFKICPAFGWRLNNSSRLWVPDKNTVVGAAIRQKIKRIGDYRCHAIDWMAKSGMAGMMMYKDGSEIYSMRCQMTCNEDGSEYLFMIPPAFLNDPRLAKVLAGAEEIEADKFIERCWKTHLHVVK